MAKSTGVVLTASGIAFANEWAQTNTPNIRIIIGGLGAAFFLAGVERLNERAGVGLAWMLMIAALTLPVNGKSPAQTVLAWQQQKPQQPKGKVQ